MTNVSSAIPLDAWELAEVIFAAYPEKFPEEVDDDDGDSFDVVMEFAASLSGVDDISDLLGRVVMLALPKYSPFTETYSHCLGEVTLESGRVDICALVTRDVVMPKDAKYTSDEIKQSVELK